MLNAEGMPRPGDLLPWSSARGIRPTARHSRAVLDSHAPSGPPWGELRCAACASGPGARGEFRRPRGIRGLEPPLDFKSSGLPGPGLEHARVRESPWQTG